MKAVILAGGFGTRISEETSVRPKPMVEIGNRPILWHIMKIYSAYGFREFVICCGYKGSMIKNYFIRYLLHNSDSSYNLSTGNIQHNNLCAEPFLVTLADTGLETLTAGRLLQIQEYIDDDIFMLTYGDGIGDININKVLEFHKKHGKICTITTSRLEGRFGVLNLDEKSGIVKGFNEKIKKDQGWVNIGFMVCKKEIFQYLADGSDMLEKSPFQKLLKDEELMAYLHKGFWSPMDMLKDKEYLESLWNQGNPPWKVWKD